MASVQDLLSELIFGGIPSNAAYDLLKAGWKRTTARSWEDLYIESFEAALGDSRARLKRYGDSVSLDRDQLRRVLDHELGATLSDLSLSKLSQSEFVEKLAAHMAAKQVLILGGHTLTEEDYLQITTNLIQQAVERFRRVAISVKFQDALMLEATGNNSLLSETREFIAVQFDVILQTLNQYLRSVDLQKQILEEILITTQSAGDPVMRAEKDLRLAARERDLMSWTEFRRISTHREGLVARLTAAECAFALRMSLQHGYHVPFWCRVNSQNCDAIAEIVDPFLSTCGDRPVLRAAYALEGLQEDLRQRAVERILSLTDDSDPCRRILPAAINGQVRKYLRDELRLDPSLTAKVDQVLKELAESSE